LNLSVDEPDEFETGEGGQETSMNHSIYSADRTTHLKIVVVALVVGILVAGFGISARNSSDEGFTQTARVMKAGKPVVVTSSGNSVVR
jgi:L-asparaginase/Glu-tRNA(Gln) amidotransferase subunit D